MNTIEKEMLKNIHFEYVIVTTPLGKVLIKMYT